MPVTSREMTARNGDVTLAGTLWLPPERPTATVLMHPGSGPSDRDNDVLFPPIREHLLTAGVAVCSFDKRGVGGSTGRWQDAAIVEQTDDVLAALSALDEELDAPVGLFGHSQGGWVVIEAAGRRAPVAFVISSSGPGVTPAAQERYSALTYLRSAGVAPSKIDEATRDFEIVVAMMRERTQFEDARRRIGDDGLGAAYDELDLPFVPGDAAEWDFACALIDYDPRPSLERIDVPVLALFGGDDTIVPVDESVRVYRDAVRPDLLTVTVFPGADHRVHVGDPRRHADGYLEALSSFVASTAA
jgi:pimeloyl-ACP methyl ester carboxylesterase